MAENKTKNTVRDEAKQVGRFGVIGIINTVLDVGLYNLLFGVFNLTPIPANIFSTSVAMVFSFVANRSFVFRTEQKDTLRQAVKFLLVTICSAYLIQSGVIYLFTKVWPAPFEWGHDLLNTLGIKAFTEEFVVNNGAKALALGFGMVWNYLWYKKVVFKK